ncbi:MAG: 2-phosphosulfolactate phosphatase [Candidatus Dormibacteraeota bacterium]|nr:2-phosphosulfolactate phosphatase [Candidatus Dormibacteraeota bacterium]
MIIDVFRAFSVSAYALAAGAACCRLVREVEEAQALAARIPGSVMSAEVDGLPVAGIPISNSPTQITQIDLRGRVLVQRTSAGTQAMAAATRAERRYAGSLVVAGATARELRDSGCDLVTLVASRPDHHEDVACARLLEALLLESPVPADLFEALYASPRYHEVSSGVRAGFPSTDCTLALMTDRFDFTMPVDTDELGIRVTARRAPG